MKRLDISGLRKNRSINFKIGLILSLSLVIAAFRITITPKIVETTVIPYAEELTVELVEIPKEQSKVKQIPNPNVLQVLDLTKEMDYEIELVQEPNPDVTQNNNSQAPVFSDSISSIYAPPPLPPGPQIDEFKRIWSRVEKMPQFGECEATIDTEKERIKCSEANLLSFIYGKIRYPHLAVDNGIEGKVIVAFVVDQNGEIEDVQVLRDIGGGCGEECIRVINQLPTWIPGKQSGQPVKVQYRIPIDFQLK